MAASAAASVDIVVVGAGVTGSAAAVNFAKDGRRVVCIERSMAEPNRIVGELMQPGGVRTLAKLGLEACLDGIDSPESKGYVVYKQDGSFVKMAYPADAEAKASGSPVVARTFHHGRFIMRLREALLATPGVTTIEGTVKKLIEESGRVVGVQYVQKNDDGILTREIRAPLVVVCDGCNSDFRREMLTTTPYAASRFVGLILKTTLPFPNHGHVILADPSPVLMYPISSTEIRVLVDVPLDPETGRIPSAPSGELARHLLKVTAPQVPAELRHEFIKQVERIRDDPVSPNSFPSMASSSLHPDPFVRRGTVLLGDSFNMRHPLTGGGMSVGLNDVLLLVTALRGIDLANDAAMTIALRHYYRQRYPLAATVNVLASALYGVFAATGPTMAPLRDACFRYFELGGVCVDHPMNMLGAKLPSPALLCTHFYAVAIVAVQQVIFKNSWIPWPSSVVRAGRVLWNACKILVPVLQREGVLSLFPRECRYM